MSIFIDTSTRLVIQGITGRDGSFHAKQMIEYGTSVVAGVTPGKGGQRFEGTVPVFNTVAESVRETKANAAVIYVPAAVALSEKARFSRPVPVIGSDRFITSCGVASANAQLLRERLSRSP